MIPVQSKRNLGHQNQQQQRLKLDDLQWHNQSIKYLPIDNSRNTQPRPVSGYIYSRVLPLPLKKPSLVAISEDALSLLNLDCDHLEEEKLIDVFSGNTLLEGSDPIAHNYCGYQFVLSTGSFAGQLGDGAAVLLGEVKSGDQILSLQLKGSGLTPYSRSADGRKVLRSSIREFLCSEHLDALSICTTRAGVIIASESRVWRDIFYTGHPKAEKCSVILRIAKTFLRFGSFEIFKPRDRETGRSGPSVGHSKLLLRLANFTIFTLFPHLVEGISQDEYLPEKGDASLLDVEVYRKWVFEIIERTAKLVAQWQCVGWCHGVLNTDNMSITGDTLDYGPFGFMEIYDPHYICNSSDHMGRYTYKQQVDMCRWNCERLLEDLQELHLMESAVDSLKIHFDQVYECQYLKGMRAKLGLSQHQKDKEEDSDLFQDLFITMRKTASDFTTIFRILKKIDVEANSNDVIALHVDVVLEEILESLGTLDDLQRSTEVVGMNESNQLEDALNQFSANPMFRIMFGIQDATFELWKDKLQFRTEMDNVLQQKIEKRQVDRNLWNNWMEKYISRLLSEARAAPELSKFNEDRKISMKWSNPNVVLRNHLAQQAIDKAEEGDYTEVQRLLWVLRHPYDENQLPSDMTRGQKGVLYQVSCSS